MTKVKLLGVSGDAGSFSEQAGLLYAKNNKLNLKLDYLTDSENVLAALEANKIELGLFPVVNNIGGLVQMSLQAMGQHSFEVIDEISLEINQCLLVKSGTKINQIKHIISHPQPIKQCKNYLLKYFLNGHIMEHQDTAKAARELSENKLPEHSAVIAPESSAKLYGLDILDRNIQDITPNLTTFIIVKSRSTS
ncbi:MAG TPA: prephenate dehydratase domain-containing protein [Gammaproteobacteria bacterium]|nr:prephenate dehydratase domain-containing protein [Gammaproteobacteria bacterium]